MNRTQIEVYRQDIKYTTTLSTLSCGSCGIPFAIPSDMMGRLKDTGEAFWCPNGHHISYAENENDRLRRERDLARSRARDAEAAWTHEHDQRKAAEKSAAAYKGQAMKMRKRIGHGVCPCCHRTFQQVSRHMDRMHPDWAES